MASLLDRLKTIINKSQATHPAFNKAVYNYLGNSVIWNPENDDTYINKGYRHNATVYSIVNLISKSATTIPLCIYEVKKENELKRYKALTSSGFDPNVLHRSEMIKKNALVEVEDTELHELLSRPNPAQSFNSFLAEIIAFHSITGNSYVYGIKPDSGSNKHKYMELYVLPSQNVEINSGGIMQPVKEYTLTYNGTYRMPAECVLHMKDFNPYFDGTGSHLYGMSPLKAGLRSMDANNEALTAGVKYLQNGTARGMLVADEGDLNEVQAKQLKDKFREQHQGANNMGDVIITPKKLSWVNFGLSASDLTLIEQYGQTIKDLCNIYNVPVQLLNNTESSTYNNMKEAKKALYQNAVIPKMTMLRDELNRWLVPNYGDKLYLDFDFSVIPELQEESDKVVNQMSAAWWLTPNEKRAAMSYGLDDDTSEMNDYYIPSSFLPLKNEPNYQEIDIIERDQGFEEVEKAEKTYNNYPQSATNNAKRMLEWREKYGRDVVQGGTDIGWRRASQIASRSNISLSTVKRIYSFLSRHEENAKIDPKFKDEPWRDRGFVAFNLWGGAAMLPWAKKSFKTKIDSDHKTKYMIAKVNTRNILIKRAKKTYRADYERQMDIAERSQIRAFNKFLFENYQKGIRQQLTTGSVSYESLFQTDQLIDLYSNLYSEVGLRFAKFYTKEFQHLSRKATLQENTWQELFGHAGRVYAGDMVTLVSGTKKDRLKQVLRGLYSDVEFQSMGAEQQARILNNQFKGYSRNEAIRLVRTESGTAANYATSVAAKDLFDPNELVKEWMASEDGRERLSHRQADGMIVDFDKPFKIGITRRRGATEVIVGQEDMMFPSDPTASAANRINCRCTHAPFPKEDVEGEKPLQSTINVPSDVSPPKEPQNLTEREKRIREEIEKGKAKATISGGVARSWDEIGEFMQKNYPNSRFRKLDDGFLEFVDNKNSSANLKFIDDVNGQGSHHDRINGVFWNSHDNAETLYHEYGHQFAAQHKVIARTMKDVRDDAGRPITGVLDHDEELHAVLLKAFGKWEEFYKKNRNRIKHEYPKLHRPTKNREYGRAYYDLEDKYQKDMTESDWIADFGALGDTWEAISPNTVGFGHGRAYYNRFKGRYTENYFRHHEFMAHAYEVKYGGNYIMKKEFPELHDAMLDMIDEMHEIIRKRRGY